MRRSSRASRRAASLAPATASRAKVNQVRPQLAEQRLGIDLAFLGGETEPAQGFYLVLIGAHAIEMHSRQVVLRVRIAEIRCGKLKQPERKLGIGNDRAVFDSVQSINAQSD